MCLGRPQFCCAAVEILLGESGQRRWRCLVLPMLHSLFPPFFDKVPGTRCVWSGVEMCWIYFPTRQVSDEYPNMLDPPMILSYKSDFLPGLRPVPPAQSMMHHRYGAFLKSSSVIKELLGKKQMGGSNCRPLGYQMSRSTQFIDPL